MRPEPLARGAGALHGGGGRAGWWQAGLGRTRHSLHPPSTGEGNRHATQRLTRGVAYAAGFRGECAVWVIRASGRLEAVMRVAHAAATWSAWSTASSSALVRRNNRPPRCASPDEQGTAGWGNLPTPRSRGTPCLAFPRKKYRSAPHRPLTAGRVPPNLPCVRYWARRLAPPIQLAAPHPRIRACISPDRFDAVSKSLLRGRTNSIE